MGHSGALRLRLLAIAGAAALFTVGCQSVDDRSPEATGTATVSPGAGPTTVSPSAVPGRSLGVPELNQALPDRESLPGWNRTGDPTAHTDRFVCQSVFDNGCAGTKAIAYVDFTRGPRTTEEWVRLTFNLYSGDSEQSTRELSAALSVSGDELRLDEVPPADELITTRDKTGPATVLQAKARVGDVLIWIVVMGSEQSATPERLQGALTLAYERVLQAKGGTTPTAGASID
ncbi:hypothetical protein ABZX40_24760 [Streptomyces sp. NPDC004610]|uniref:hypothetical protein n=1 Tax=unclassified Streptomyces TaxID=2593676 RepID=UPI0033AA3DBD